MKSDKGKNMNKFKNLLHSKILTLVVSSHLKFFLYGVQYFAFSFSKHVLTFVSSVIFKIVEHMNTSESFL